MKLNMKKYIILSIAAMMVASMADMQAQTKGFKLGQWSEIQNAIVKELNRSYVDSLPVDRMMRAGIDATLSELDPYTIYIPDEEDDDFQMMISNTYGGIGAIIHKKKGEYVIINEPYANSPAQKYGLRCGDEIMEINGTCTKNLEVKESSEMMKGKPGSSVRFKIKKAISGDIVEVDVVRERIHLPDVEYSGMLNDTTGYILQTGFTEGVSEIVKSRFNELKKKGMKRFVLDLRNNGGGLMSEAVNIVSLFVPKGSLVVSAKGREEESTREYHTTTEPIDTQIPIIVMINGASASSSEIVSGALQDMDRAVIMGKRSYGKGLVQSIRPLPYNGKMKVTTAKYYTPSGRCVQAIDYSHRNEDGSVGHIPDSLTNEFKTAKGRIVRDGGGITPDVAIEYPEYSRLTYSLVLSGVIDNYAIKYAKEHATLPSVEEFHFSDSDYENFIAFAKTQEFDYRSSAKTLFDQMKKELTKDGLIETMSEELKTIEEKLEMDKEQFLRIKKDEITQFIEEELATRYYFQEARVKIRLRYDAQLKEALEKKL